MNPNTTTPSVEITYLEEKLPADKVGRKIQNADLHTLWNALADPAFIVSTNDEILAANYPARMQYQLQDRSLASSAFSDFFNEPAAEDLRSVLKQAGEEQAVIFTGIMTDRSQLQIAVEVVVKSGTWDQQNVLFCFCRDLRPRNVLEEKVEQLQKQLEEALGAAFAFQWNMTADLNKNVVLRKLSSSASKVTGYSVAEMLNERKDWLSSVHPEDRAYVEENLNQRVVGRTQETIEYRIVHRDGSLRWVQDILENRRLAAGRVLLSGVMKDITDRKRAEDIRQQSNDQLLQWINELKQRNTEATLLNEMGDLLQSSLDIEDVFMVVRRFAMQLFSGQSGALYLFDSTLNLLETRISWGKNPPNRLDFHPEDCWGLRRNRVAVGHSSTDIHCKHVSADHCRSYLCVPMTVQTETLGLLHLCSNKDQPLEYLTQLSLMFASRVALALSNLRLSETLRHQSIRDPLTGLYNRRYLEEMLTRELRRATRHNRPIGIIMADIDHFKEFNDQFGHAAGDLVLKEVSKFLQTQVRGEDIICRFGGEEFIAVLVEASLPDTEKRANLLREGVEALNVEYGEVTLGNVTVSFGVCAFPQHGKTAESLIEAADNALYRAKHAGRNRVMIAA